MKNKNLDRQKILQKMIRDMDPIIAAFVDDDSRNPKKDDEENKEETSEKDED